MERKTIAPVTVACYELKTSLMRIGELVGAAPKMIADELERQGVGIADAQIWQYEGCDGDPQREFVLKIMFPVFATGTDTETIRFETLPQFDCVVHTHRGGWGGLKDAYAEMFGHLMQNNMQMNGLNREVYLHCDFENEDNCVTEIQLGINM